MGKDGKDGEKLEASFTGGVKSMNIATRLVSERERLFSMTDEERAYRKQWLLDQKLSSDEPKFVDEYWRQRMNPIRRFYRWPLDKAMLMLQPLVGQRIIGLRYFAGKILMIGCGVMGIHYYFKYQGNDWTTKSGWRVTMSRSRSLVGDVDYPNNAPKKPAEYLANRKFSDSPI